MIKLSKAAFVAAFFTLAALSVIAAPATAQNSKVVAVCGALPTNYTAGGTGLATVDVEGVTCTDAAGGGAAGDASAANQTSQITQETASAASLAIIDNMISGSGVNVSQINGVAPLMGAGVTGTGSPRTTTASNSPDVTALGAPADSTCGTASGTCSITALLKYLNVNGIGGGAGDASAANQATEITSLQLLDNAISGSGYNISQINGVTPLMGAGATGTGSPRVTLATDSPGHATYGQTGVASPAIGVAVLCANETSYVAAGNGQVKSVLCQGPVAAPTAAAVPSWTMYQGANVGGLLTGSIKCGSSIVYDASTNGATQLVALASTQTIYVCGYTLMAAGTVNVDLRYGTGSNCATGGTKILPAWQLIAQAGIGESSAEYRGLKTAASNALCINTSAGIAVQAVVYYTQF